MINVFISYRRDGVYKHEGEMNARSISQHFKLTQKDIQMFYDIESMHAGKFNHQIYSEIKKCDCIVLLLPKGAFDRCSNEDDWVRQEIHLGLRYGKPFIPVCLEGFEWPETLPNDISEVKNYQAMNLHNAYFDSGMDKLTRMIHESVHRDYRTASSSQWIKYLPAISISAVVLLLGGILLHHYITGLPDYDTFGQEEIASNTSDSTENDVVETFPDIATVPPDSFADTPDENTDGIWDSYLTIYGIYKPSGEYSWSADLEKVESMTYWFGYIDAVYEEKELTGPSEGNVLLNLGTTPADCDITLYVEAKCTDGTSFAEYYYIDTYPTGFGNAESAYLPSVNLEQESNDLSITAYSTEKILLCKYGYGLKENTSYMNYIFDYSQLNTEFTIYESEDIHPYDLAGAEWLNAYALNGSGNYTIHTYRIPDSIKNPQ